MPAIVIERFGGLSPRTDPAMLPNNGAQVATDVRLHAGAIRGWRKPSILAPAIPTITDVVTIWFDPGEEVWYQWDSDVDIVLGPVADGDDNRRYYYTGDGVPKKTDSAMAILGAGTYPRTSLKMGVPKPTAAATEAGGTGALTRVYVYTNVSEFSGIEEESAPSPPTTVTDWASGDTITLAGMTAVPAAPDYNVTKRRLYRSSGSAYIFVKEFVGVSTTDNATDESLVGNDALQSLTWDPPPNGLKGLVSMANGILAGFVGNQLYFCEPYQPHAWPVAYVQTTDYKIVALVAVGQGVYVLTTGHPYYCAGTHPASMTMDKVSKYAPCASKRSAVTDGSGCLYATYNGVAYLQGNNLRNMTEGMFTQEEWGAYGPSGMYGVYYDDRYTLWYPQTETEPLLLDGSWTLDGSETLDGEKGSTLDTGDALVFDTTVQDAPLTIMQTYTSAAHIRADTGKLYLAYDGQISQFDADELNRTPYDWKSKLFVLSRPMNFPWVQVYADHSGSAVTAAAIAAAQAIAEANAILWAAGAYNAGWAVAGVNQWEWNGSEMTSSHDVDTLFLTLKVYADGILRFSANVTSNAPLRLPAGFKSDQWEIQVGGNKTVRRIVMATSMQELQSA